MCVTSDLATSLCLSLSTFRLRRLSEYTAKFQETVKTHLFNLSYNRVWSSVIRNIGLNLINIELN